MAYENRVTRDYLIGTIKLALALSDTALVSDAFVDAGTGYNASTYMPVVLHDPAELRYEVVWITAHTAGSDAVTILRGREGTSAQAWPTGTEVLSAVTTRDVLTAVSTRTALPADPHNGMRVLVGDEGHVYERSGAVWTLPTSLGSAPFQVGPSRGGIMPPESANIQFRAGQHGATTNGSGDVTVAYRTPFVARTMCVVITNSNLAAFTGTFIQHAETAAGFTVRAMTTGGNFAANQSVGFAYQAIGW